MATLDQIVFDSLNPPALARFWAAALDGYAVRSYDDAEIARLAAKGRRPDTDPSVAVDGPGPTLFFQEVTQRKTERNRVHLDVATSDRAGEVRRLLALGATIARVCAGFTVLRDPEGNELCVADR